MARHFIVRICLLCLIVSAALAEPAQQPTSDTDATVSAKLQSIERNWLDAEKNHNAAAFEKIVADDWVAITPDGKCQTKAERAAEIKSAHTTSATLGDMKVRVFGNAAVVTGTDDEVTEENGKKSVEHYVWTDVFVNRDSVARCRLPDCATQIARTPIHCEYQPECGDHPAHERHCVSLHWWRQAGHTPPVSNVFHSLPQVHDQRSSSRGDQPESGQRILGPDGSRLFSCSVLAI